MSRWILVPLFLLLTVTGVHAQEVTPEVSPSLISGGLERTYRLHVPEDLTQPAPLVIVLHGRGGTGRHIEGYTGFDELADREGFIAAYPDGLNNEWNYVHNIIGYSDTHDDIAFLIALVDQIAQDYAVDLSRVYIAGFSNGGFMAERVACENPTRFAAFASVSAAGFGGMLDVCQKAGTVSAPMLLIHGTADDNVPWTGLGSTHGDQTIYVLYPVPDTLGYWAEFNGCQGKAETTDLPELGDSPGTSVRILTVDCPSDASVMLYGVIGGGHNWPGKAEGIPAQIAGQVNLDFDATEVIWDFFAQHQRLQSTPEATEEAPNSP